MVYKIAAEVPGCGTEIDVVGCFDPTVVIARLRRAFPDEVEVDPEDQGWKDYKAMLRLGGYEPALRTAERDAQRRAPIRLFRFPTGTEQVVYGKAERYHVSIWSEQPIPEPLKSRFLEFLRGLEFLSPTVRSERIEGNMCEEA